MKGPFALCLFFLFLMYQWRALGWVLTVSASHCWLLRCVSGVRAGCSPTAFVLDNSRLRSTSTKPSCLFRSGAAASLDRPVRLISDRPATGFLLYRSLMLNKRTDETNITNKMTDANGKLKKPSMDQLMQLAEAARQRKWPSTDVRELYLLFFEHFDHLRYPSSPVVPHGDNTLLFINAGKLEERC